MPTHDTQPAGFQPPATAPKVSPYAPRPFEVVEAGQTSTNPFARRPHEVWTAEPPSSPTAPPEVQAQEEPQGVGTFWTEFRMNAPGTPPLPPPNLGRSGSVPAVQREPVTPEPYWYQGPPAQTMAAPVQESSAAAPSASGPLVQQQANGETETVPEPPGIGTFWTEFRMNAPGTPPMPPPNLGRSGRSPAIQRDPVTPEPYWYQGPPIQAKLTVGAPNDAYEQEADRVAAQVMTMPAPASSLQRQEAPDIEEAEEIPGLQTRAIADSITPLVQRQPDEIDEELVQPKCETCEQEQEEPIQRHLDGLASQPTLSEPQPTPDIQRDPSGMPPKKGTTQITKNSATLTASGKTITEAITNLTSQGKGEAGSVTCTPARDFKTYQADDKADPVVYEADVQVTETKAMPVWTELNQQCEPVKKEWTRFYGALDTHENGHISRDEKAFTNLHTKLLGKKEADANKIFNDTTTKADTDNAAYDTATQHGLTQGTAVTPVQCGPEKVSQNPGESGTEPLAQVESTPEPAVQTKPNRPTIQRRTDETSPVQPDLESRLNGSKGSGSPLPSDVRSFMEPRFGADFSQVRVHTGSDAVRMNREVGAKAFTHKQDIYFNAGHYSPGSASGKELLAHELTHTIQQTGGIHRKSKPLQRKIDPAAEMGPLAAKAIAQTIEPFNRSSLQRQSATPEAEPETENLLQAKTLSQTPISFLNRAAQPDLTAEEEPELQAKSLPEKALSVQAQASSLDGKSIQTKALVTSTGAPQVQRGLWDTVKSGVRSVASGVSNVAEGVSDTVSGGLDAIRQRLLQPVAQLASRMPGYPLLTVILGRDPVTGNAVERNATNLIQGILSFVPGGDQMFRNLQESRALENAFHWLSEQVTRLNLTWDAIRGLFQRTWESLSAGDLLNPGAAFERIRNIFAEPVQRIRNFASAVGQKILEFVFEGAIRLAGGSADQVMGIIRRAGGVFTNIIRDPIAFVGNLVQAVKGGFQSFAGNILTHLRSGLMGWLFGALAGAGLQMPQSFDLRGIVSIVLQVIGATYQRLRGMLARRIGEQRVARLEQAFSFLQTLATEGLAGAWQQIMEFAGNLQEMVIGGIREWVMSSIVQAAVTRLVSMFNPAGAVIQAAIAVYNTVMFFVERAQQIAALANSVFESIGRIASGNIGGAIAYVEQAMARSLPVIISFMARLLGLGNVAGQIRNIIGRVQGAVERAIERLVGWITTRARSLLGRGGGTGSRATTQQQSDNNVRNHEALADQVVSELKQTDDSPKNYQALRTEKEAQARQIEQTYTSRLEPGIRLTVQFSDTSSDRADGDIDFRVIIAPNTTTKTGSVAPTKPPDWTIGTPASALLSSGSQVSGNFPLDGATPREVKYRKNGASYTSYIVYDDNGRAIKRVDVTGRAHGGIATPHVVEYKHNSNPSGQIFVQPERMVRPTRPEEVP